MIDPETSKPEGYDELLDKFLERLPPEELARRLAPEERLRGLPPEELARRLAPEERLRGLSFEQTLLALPVEILRGLSDEYLRALPEPLQQAIRDRLARR